jgi:hypothetical protein
MDVIDNENHCHTQYEKKEKAADLVWHAWQGLAEDEGESHRNCAHSDNSKDE